MIDFAATTHLDALQASWPRSGNPAVRFGFVVTLFFDNGESVDMRLACLRVVRHFYETFHSKLTHYQKMDSGRLSKIKDAGFLDAYEKKAKGAAEAVSYDVIGVADGDDVDDPAFWAASATAMGPWALQPAGAAFLDLYMPASFVAESGPKKMIDLVKIWCNLLRPRHGTAGFGTLFNQGAGRGSLSSLAFPFVKRFPGLDYNDSSQWMTARGEETRPLIRTTNWLTVLSTPYVEALGGENVTTTLPASCVTHALEDGLLVAAGPTPQLGDINRGLVLDDYRAVAKVAAPLLFEGFKAYRSLFTDVPEPLDPVEESRKWVRRFD